MKLADVQAELPADMKAMDKDEAGGGDREEAEGAQAINKRIVELSKLRRKELDAREAGRRAQGAADGFDVAAKKALTQVGEATTPLSGLNL